MKLDNAKLGAQALRRLRQTTADARRVQERVLLSLLSRNRDTEFGKAYGFARMGSVRDYQARMPLTTYENYGGYIDRMIAGGHGLLTREDPAFYSLSSGSTGDPRYVPLSRRDICGILLYIYGGVYGMLGEYYRDAPPPALFGPIFQAGEFARTFLADGTMSGILSGSHYRWMERAGLFDFDAYTAPPEVLFPDRMCDLTYVKIRFALAERNVCAIHSVFVTQLVRLLRYMEQNWELLLADMERGTVDERIVLPDGWREKMRRWLPPDPGRAAELRALDIPAGSGRMIPRIWPRIAYLISIGGGSFSSYMEVLDRYRGDVPVHHNAYGASEGLFGVSAGLNRPDAYILLPEMGFFEFIPEAGGEPLTMGQVRAGERYALVFTNRSGFYRYRIEDVIEVTGFCGQAPIVRFCYRRNLMLNMMDEKTSSEHLELAMNYLTAETGLRALDFCMRENTEQEPGHYVFYLEAQPDFSPAELARRLDACLCRASFSYRSVRGMGELGPLAVAFILPGSFAAYEDDRERQGCSPIQRKPVRILRSETDIQFFERRICAT